MALLVTVVGVVFAGFGCSSQQDEELDRIRALHTTGAVKEVVAALQRFLVEDPDHAEAQFLLGSVLLHAGRSVPAIEALESAAKDPEFARTAGLLLASTYYEMRAYEEAIAASTKVIDVDSTSSTALLTRGRSQIAAGRPGEAITDATRILEIDPDHQNANLLKSRALIELERIDEAEKLWINLHTRLSSQDRPNQAALACGQLARFYYSQNVGESADRTYQKCLAQYPTHAYLQRWASDFYMRTGEPDRATELHRRAIEAAPDDLRLWARLATMLVIFGEPEEAERTLIEASTRFDSLESWRLLADFHLERNDPDRARAALETAITKSPSPNQSALFALADLLVTMGNVDRAREIETQITEPIYQYLLQGAFRLHSQDPDGALEQFDAALAIWPKSPRGRYQAGEAALGTGDHERAVSEFQMALQFGEGETDAALRLAEIHFAAGQPRVALGFAQRQILRRPHLDAAPFRIAIRSALALGELEAAEKFANKLEKADIDTLAWVMETAAVKRQIGGAKAASQFIVSQDRDLTDPREAQLLRELANDWSAIGRASDALSLVDRVLDTSTSRAADNTSRKAIGEATAEMANERRGRASLHELRARILMRLEQFDLAEKAADLALELDPDLASALEVRAKLALERGDSVAALAAFDAAAAAAPRNPHFPHVSASIARELGDDDRAVAYLEDALSRQPTYALAASDLALLLAAQGRELDRALSLARLAVSQSGTSSALGTLGWVRYQRGEFNLAVSTFRSLLQREPNRPTTQYRLGLSLVASGDVRGAREVFERLLDGPAFPETEQTRAELARLDES